MREKKKKISENSCNSWQKTQSRQEQKANTEDYEQQRREGAGVGGWRWKEHLQTWYE